MKVIHVYLIFRKRGFVFGSITAIFNYISEDELGMKKSTLLHRASENTIMTKRAIITKSTLLRSKRKCSGNENKTKDV